MSPQSLPRVLRLLPALLAAGLLTHAACADSPRPAPASPSEHFGFSVGADRQLADYHQMSSYFHTLAKASPRVQVEVLGRTTQGRDLLMTVISSEENLKNKTRYQNLSRRLADPRGLSESQIQDLASQGKAILLVTCAIHSSEIASTQMALEWAHQLASAQDAETLRRLDEVILLLVPSLNPDGHQMEVDWYRRHVGTPYEGGRMPWLYHPYAGHDNNRDWVHLNLKESQALNRAVYHVWQPQVWLDEHQMEMTGPRIFLPPFSNPAAPTVHPLVWRTIDRAGMDMSWQLEREGKAGAIYGALFDAYWPGGTKNTSWWKHIAGLLSEVASVRVASPVELHPTELRGGGKGFSEYGPQINFPNPWKGGTWCLRDIMDYELTISNTLLGHCAQHREELLRGKAAMAQDATKQGEVRTSWRIPLQSQHDAPTAARLARLLMEHGVEVHFSVSESAFYIPTAQPYGPFVAEMFSAQRYPEVRPVPGAAILPPYDVSAWSLPLHFGVNVERVPTPGSGLRLAQSTDGPRGGLGAGPALRYALGRESNSATALLNEHLRQGGRAAVALAAFSEGGRTHPRGTLLLEPTSNLAQLAERHGLRLEALAQVPDGPQAPQKRPRVGLYRPWSASMDEGWTRLVLEQAGFEPKTLEPREIRSGKLREAFDVLVLPNVSRSTILEGKRDSTHGPSEELPPPYQGGLGKEGSHALRDFVGQGGILVALGESTEFAVSELELPTRNVLEGKEGFESRGALLRLRVDTEHPVGWGLPREVAAFQKGRQAFQTGPSGPMTSHRVLASYPRDHRDILLAGWAQGLEEVEHRSAALAFRKGKGSVVLFGFSVQHRAQTEGTFKLLFNALNWAGLEEDFPK